DAQRYSQLLAAWVRVAREGDLLMCHPSTATHDSDAIIGTRTQEFQVLTGLGFPMQLSDAGIKLRPMSRILDRVTALDEEPTE
ncbi:MAG TPA: hypothetical protein VIY30_15935, partial [Burkholderiaceae bacterium]